MKVRGRERSSDWATLQESSLSGSESGSQSVSAFKAIGRANAAIEGLLPIDFDNDSDPDSDTDADDLPQRHPEKAGQFSLPSKA